MKKLTHSDIDLLEKFWIEKSRKNFLAYRMYIRHGLFRNSWFMTEICRVLQNFYIDYKNKKRPVYIINTPPQHGKSFSVIDFITWIIGLLPETKIIYSSYAERLGKRANKGIQRTFDHEKYKKIFPDLNVVNPGNKGEYNSELLETWNINKKYHTGFFRNTTTGGAITGDTMDIGIIDDPVKGRKEARSMVISQSIWEWFEDDFGTRLSEYGGILIIMTRWVTHDLTARLIELNPNTKVFNFQAIATKDEINRNEGDPLFPELKSLEFLENKKKMSSEESWESLYQGNPTITGGNMVKDHWWKWWKVLPPIKFKFITADTAQKEKTHNDYTDFKCWGFGIDNNLYMLDHKRGKFEAPELRREAEIFYRKHDTKREKVGDPILRGMYIEDKSSGTGLIQELKRKRLKIYEVPRTKDKITRCEDASPYIEAGRVWLNTEIDDIGNTTKEAREFPNSEFDDDFDNVMLGIEIAFINKNITGSLKAAMSVED